MKKNLFSLSSQGLRYKLKVAFYLMSILPLFVCAYIVYHYVIPRTGLKLDIVLSFLISLVITLLGFSVIKEVFDGIVALTTQAKLIAAGNVNCALDVSTRDEIGDLSLALNQLTGRIRSNMNELKIYGEKTTEINFEIQRRVIVLSSLLQISSLISQGARLDEIIKLTIEKSRLIANSDVSYLLFREESRDEFYIRAADGINVQELIKIKVGPDDIIYKSIFTKIIKINKPLILDKSNTLPQEISSAFYNKFALKNTLALPIYLRGKVMAIIGIGNAKESFSYKVDDIDLLDVFAKQMAIAIDNDILIRKVERLEIRDALTGLYNEGYMHDRLQEEIKRAIIYHRPCAFILLNIDDFGNFHNSFGSLQAEGVIKKVAFLIKESVGEIDRVARSGDNEFAVVLPEKNKRQAQEIAEIIRKKIEFSFSEEPDTDRRITISGGVSENPLDGIEANELIAKAKELLKVAKSEGKNRVLI